MAAVAGLLGYFGLGDWWLGEFSDQERAYILYKYQPMGSSSDSLTRGRVSASGHSPVSLLSNLSAWVVKDEERHLAYRILAKAAALVGPDTPVLDVHFLDHHMIKTYYRDRALPAYLEATVAACRHQIALAPSAAAAFRQQDASLGMAGSPLPSHTGYKQLAIILEKQKSFSEAIGLCELARSQGWTDDWEPRIERLRQRQAKSG